MVTLEAISDVPAPMSPVSGTQIDEMRESYSERHV
jgi:hypothetical protein